MELTTKAERIYIMLDKKSDDVALVKTGKSADNLRNRFHAYKTGNPWLECVAICEIRKKQTLSNVEKLFHIFCEENFTHVCGEWYLIEGKDEIEKIETMGFNYFGKLVYRIKAKENINKKVCELWENRKSAAALA